MRVKLKYNWTSDDWFWNLIFMTSDFADKSIDEEVSKQDNRRANRIHLSIIVSPIWFIATNWDVPTHQNLTIFISGTLTFPRQLEAEPPSLLCVGTLSVWPELNIEESLLLALFLSRNFKPAGPAKTLRSEIYMLQVLQLADFFTPAFRVTPNRLTCYVTWPTSKSTTDFCTIELEF